MAALTAIAGIVSAVGTIAAGKAEQNNQNYVAKQEDMKAKEEMASSQREAQQNLNEADLANSRAQALAASSGGGAGAEAPTIVKLMSDTAGQGTLNANTTLYGGMERASGLRDSAKGRRAAGKASFLGSVLGGFGQAAGGFSKAFG
jgi:CRISPR/Cas system CSM-associated protein Csm5 (group 7 of RAMP superfamily)